MKGNLRLLQAIAVVFGGVALIGAAGPSALSQAQGGLWEIDRTGTTPVKLCLANPIALAQFEHRGSRCVRKVLRDSGTTATISYTCPGSNFGESNLTVVTPRSLRVETQGISGDGPFNYTFQARRVGDCPAH